MLLCGFFLLTNELIACSIGNTIAVRFKPRQCHDITTMARPKLPHLQLPHCHGLGNIQCTRSESLNTSRAREPARALELSRALARARARATRPATLWRGRWRDYRPRLTALAPRGRGRERGRGQGRGRWQASPRFAGPPPRWPSSLPSPCAVRALALVPAHSCQ